MRRTKKARGLGTATTRQHRFAKTGNASNKDKCYLMKLFRQSGQRCSHKVIKLLTKKEVAEYIQELEALVGG